MIGGDTAAQRAGVVHDDRSGWRDHGSVEFRVAVERETTGGDFEREPVGIQLVAGDRIERDAAGKTQPNRTGELQRTAAISA